jgi:hypothetical protein
MGKTWLWASPGQADAMAREDYREAREDEARLVARAEAEDARVAAAEHAARVFEYTHGYSQGEYRQAVAEIAVAKEQRRQGGEYGSAQRAAVFVDGVPLAPRERQSPRRDDENDRLLAEAARQASDGFMAAEVARFHRRRGAEVSRSRSLASRGEVTCGECIAAGASPAESAQIHEASQRREPYCRGCGRLQGACGCPSRRQAATGYREITR